MATTSLLYSSGWRRALIRKLAMPEPSEKDIVNRAYEIWNATEGQRGREEALGVSKEELQKAVIRSVTLPPQFAGAWS